MRRALYVFAASGALVSRDEAAEALGVSRNLAAFHLDKLAAVGLLEVTYRRLGERQGPGAGRPAQLYRRSTLSVEVSLPGRRYHLVGAVLARALETGATPSPLDAVRREGRALGREAGSQFRTAHPTAPGRSGVAQTAAVEAVLGDVGYEPVRRGRSLVLQNCPFQVLAERHREVVCTMNRAFVGGVLAGLDTTALTTRRSDGADGCCVAVVAVDQRRRRR
jgi:predicted ArsR family transcriptional regulator